MEGESRVERWKKREDKAECDKQEDKAHFARMTQISKMVLRKPIFEQSFLIRFCKTAVVCILYL